MTDLTNPDPLIDAPEVHATKMEACQAAISQAMLDAQRDGEPATIRVCLNCPRDWTGHSCAACDTITVLPCGKVTFESIQ